MLFKIFIATCIFSFLLSLCVVTYFDVVPTRERSFIGFVSHSILNVVIEIEDYKLEISKSLWYKILLLSEVLSILIYLHITIIYFMFFNT